MVFSRFPYCPLLRKLPFGDAVDGKGRSVATPTARQLRMGVVPAFWDIRPQSWGNWESGALYTPFLALHSRTIYRNHSSTILYWILEIMGIEESLRYDRTLASEGRNKEFGV